VQSVEQYQFGVSNGCVTVLTQTGEMHMSIHIERQAYIMLQHRHHKGCLQLPSSQGLSAAALMHSFCYAVLANGFPG
jgi:hypothetical protein